MTVDAAGALYVCDPEYRRVLKVSAAGDASVIPANFSASRIAVDATGQIFLTSGSWEAQTIVRLPPGGATEVIAGVLYRWGHTDGIGSAARFYEPTGIALDGAGRLYVVDQDNTIRLGVVAGPPAIVTQPAALSVAAGAAVQFSVTVAGVPAPSYQWYRNAGAIAGATSSTYSFTGARESDAGDYTVVATNALGSVTSNTAALAVTPGPVVTPATPAAGGGAGAMEESFVVLLASLSCWRIRLRPVEPALRAG